MANKHQYSFFEKKSESESTFTSRYIHFVSVVNPVLFFTPNNKILEAQKYVNDLKQKEKE